MRRINGPMSEAAKQAKRDAWQRRWADPEFREAVRKRASDPVRREKQSETVRELYAATAFGRFCWECRNPHLAALTDDELSFYRALRRRGIRQKAELLRIVLSGRKASAS